MAPLDARSALDTLFNLGVDRHEEGKLEEALRIFQSLSFLAPQDLGVWQALARCHEDLDQPEIAALVLSFGEQVQEAVAS